MTKSKRDVLAEVSARVLEAMENNPGNWMKPFADSCTALPVRIDTVTKNSTGEAYRGINVPLLWMAGFTSQFWGTYKQWQKRGGQVRKGEKSTTIVFWKKVKVEDKNNPGEKKEIMFAKAYNVFNADQVENANVPEQIQFENETAKLENVDSYIAATGAAIDETGKGAAYYDPRADRIHIPNRELFSATITSTATEAYYSTKLHELAHWTGHSTRLDRFGITAPEKDAYAFEELVAELAATFNCAALGISSEPRADHAQYLASWIKRIKDDPKSFTRACSAAQKAVDYLDGFSAEQDKAA